MPTYQSTKQVSDRTAADNAVGQPVQTNAPRSQPMPMRVLEMQLPYTPPDLSRVVESEEYVVVDGNDKPALSRSQDSQDVSLQGAEQWEKQLLADPKNRLALHAFTSNSTASIISSFASRIAAPHTYNVTLPLEGAPITNQRHSGRCWLFASTNVFRVALMKKYNLKEFELSQAYLFFWDKLEKSNYFLENILDTLNEPLDGRLLQTLMADPVGDGGQWDMVANLVKKYGLVPQVLYPDSFHAKDSASISRLITSKLREYCLKLRYIASQGGVAATMQKDLEAAKETMLQEIHLILTVTLGPPPKADHSFNWDFYDKENQYHRITTTPLEFASQLSSSASGGPKAAMTGYNVNKLFSLVHDPRHEYFKLLTVSRLGNVWNGRPVTYVNVPMKLLKEGAVHMLKKGLPVFFGCDVGQFSDRASGVMDVNLFDYEVAFNVKLGMSKAQRLRTGESQMTHAMVLTGVQVEDDNDSAAVSGSQSQSSGEMKTVRWRVQNSWADTVGKDGFFVMTDAWMDEFCYQVVVDPSVVGKEARDVLEQKDPITVPLWDPLGALA